MKKWLYSLLAMSLLINITACGKSSGAPESDSGNNNTNNEQVTETKNYKAGVIDASDLFIKNGVAFWGYGPQLCSALLDKNGDLYEFVSEGSLSGEIYSIAIDGSNMYMATENGIVCLPLEEAESEQSQLSVIDDHELTTSSFQIYEENIYFTYGRRLYLVPEDGGRLVTIKAFDWDDNGYEDFPAYTIAGTSEDKKYIAIFPTDVQYDSSQETGYRKMYDYARRIDSSEEKAANNPFSCQ